MAMPFASGALRTLGVVDEVTEDREGPASPCSSASAMALYRIWTQDGEAVTVAAGRVETLELGHRYRPISPLWLPSPI
jgi:hypothetical protein